MTALRLHGTCPECRSTEPLRPDGTMIQHTRSWRVCKGTGRAPVMGSVDEWLNAQDAMARAGVGRAERAVAEAEAALARAREHADAVTKATTKARARLARKAGE